MLNFLLRYYARTKNQEALDMVLATLREMAKGGMYDQLGGGFHRYSVDARWFVPHFEKMLYDQAQLAISYLEAFQITGDASYAATARGILDYVLRDMRDPGGAFYSAEDADSVIDPAHPEEKGEGAFYIWTQSEIEAAVGQPAAEWFCHRYGVLPDGNVANDPHHEFTGKNILYQAHPVERRRAASAAIARSRAQAAGGARPARAAAPRRQSPHRLERAHDFRIRQSRRGAGSRATPDAARRAADFIARPHVRSRHRNPAAPLPPGRRGHPRFPGRLCVLHPRRCSISTKPAFEWRDLELAIRLTEKQAELFEDTGARRILQHGRGRSRAGDADEGGLRRRGAVGQFHRRAEPAAPGANHGPARISAQSAERALAAFGSRMVAAPVGVPQMLVAYEFSLSKPQQIILVGERDAPDTRRLLAALHSRFRPQSHRAAGGCRSRVLPLARYLPAVAGMTADRRPGHRLRLRKLHLPDCPPRTWTPFGQLLQ